VSGPRQAAKHDVEPAADRSRAEGLEVGIVTHLAPCCPGWDRNPRRLWFVGGPYRGGSDRFQLLDGQGERAIARLV
jgi:hypothetical protein